MFVCYIPIILTDFRYVNFVIPAFIFIHKTQIQCVYKKHLVVYQQYNRMNRIWIRMMGFERELGFDHAIPCYICTKQLDLSKCVLYPCANLHILNVSVLKPIDKTIPGVF